MFKFLKLILFIFCFFFPFFTEAKTRDQSPEVVQLYSTLHSQEVVLSSAVFVESNILVTAAHNLYQLSEPIEKNLLFKDPETQKLISVTKILHLDLEYDLAVLETGDYHSDAFYSMSEKSHFNLLDEIELIGFPLGRFQSVKGHVLGQKEHFIMSDNFYFQNLNGASGGAVVNPDTNNLKGIIIRDFGLPSTMQFVSTAYIKNLLSKQSLSCSSFIDCFNNQLTVLVSKAKKGNTDAQYSLAILYDRLNNIPLAVQWFTQAADNGSVLAKYNLGNYAFIGKGMKADIQKAIDIYEEIAQDFVFAAYRLGFIYINGVKNIPVDHEAGFHWMETAAEKHFFQAEYYLGMLHYNARGTIKDFDQAFYWVKRAADKGYSRAELQLAIMYHFGEGVEPDNDLAITWAERADQHGLTEAKIVLRVLSENH